EMSPMRRLLSALAHPNIAYILLGFASLGIYFELMNPGSILPGVVGAICLILALFSLSVLPFSYAGVALVLLAFVLFIAEIKVPSYGMLTVGGILSLALGGLLLFKSPVPALRVSYSVILLVSLFAAAVAAVLMVLVVRVHRSKVRSGQEGLIGEHGRAVADLALRGKVFVHGEYWNARAQQEIAAGSEVEVVAVDGMLLTVRPAGDNLPS
ncbi:MAG TPA: NfeD family protein, partial [Thermoanaerobaculia bacterium]|nr:NfeD family protein [Thermoanaerobaculia bacterium]